MYIVEETREKNTYRFVRSRDAEAFRNQTVCFKGGTKMKKAGLLVMLLGIIFCIPGCGFTEGTDAVVTVIKATPTPEPTPTPEVTPTPEATPTPAPVIEQTPGGTKVEVKNGTYQTTAAVNLRADCSAEAELVGSVEPGVQLNSTGVCENGWIRVDYNGTVCYASGDYVTAAAADTGAQTGAEQTADGAAAPAAEGAGAPAVQ